MSGSIGLPLGPMGLEGCRLPQGKIVRRAYQGVIAGQYSTHKDIHIGSVGSEQTQVAVQAHNPFEFYG